MNSDASNLPSGLPGIVSAEEPLARFLRHSNHFNTQGISYRAFLPNLKNMEVSVQRDDDNTRLRMHAGKTMEGHIYGVGIVSTKIVRELKLDARAQEPPERHANIVGWLSDNDSVNAKAQNKDDADVLARNAAMFQW